MIKVVEEEGLVISSIIVIVDRNSGGKENIERVGYGDRLKIIYNIQEMIEYAYYHGKHKEKNLVYKALNNKPKKLSIGDKLKMSSDPVRTRLLEIMELKNTGLCVALDISDPERCFRIADIVGPYVCMIKTHYDMWPLEDVITIFKSLRELADKHGFLIMEDRKFADIGKTTVRQINKIKPWVDIVTIHGFSMMEGLPNDIGYVVIQDMSHDLNPFDNIYGNTVFNRTKDNVVGYVTQNAICHGNDEQIFMTPGVNIDVGKVHDQNYMSLNEARSRLCDIIIVGSDIVSGTDDEIRERVETYSKTW